MVKEEGRTEEEKQTIGRVKMLEEIAKELFKGKRISRGSDWVCVNDEIFVYTQDKKVILGDQKHYDGAYNLALAYETYDCEEWTLKKAYEEPNNKE